MIKVSGACTLTHEPCTYPDIRDPLMRVFDAWGVERCLWGGDWTRASAIVNYEQAVEAFRVSAPERAMLMGGACAGEYGRSPSPASRDRARSSDSLRHQQRPGRRAGAAP